MTNNILINFQHRIGKKGYVWQITFSYHTSGDNMIEKKEIDPINIIKVIATLCVFCLHSFIFSSQWGGFSFSNCTWFLQTPAWGAVWIFIFLAGFLNGGNFLGIKRKYQLTIKGFGEFYIRRFRKIILPTWIFVIVAGTLSEPEFFCEYPNVIWKILTLRYYNAPSCISIGNVWYVCILSQLYLLTPLLCLCIDKILYVLQEKKVSGIIVLLILCAFGGLCFRIYLYQKGVDWSSQVYVPFYCNLDIYLSGILLSCVTKIKEYEKRAYYKSTISALMIYFMVVLVNTRCYYLANTNIKYLSIYQYIFPTIYILTMSVVLYLLSGWNVTYKASTIYGKVLACFSNVTFEFYLVHSMVLYRISPYLNTRSEVLQYSSNKFHLTLLIIGFIMSLFISIILKNGYKGIIGDR